MYNKMFECEFCKKTFATKSNLTLHKKTTKRCLKIQESQLSEIDVKKYTCRYCDKQFLLKQTADDHERSCKNKDTFRYEQLIKDHELLKTVNDKLNIDFILCKQRLADREEELKNVREELNKVKDCQLEKTRQDYKELIDKTVKSGKTINNYSIRINQAFEKLDVLSLESIIPRITECITTSVVKDGERSLSNAVNKVLENKILITDKSRNKAIYKNKENEMEIETGETVVRKVLKMGSDEILEQCDKAKFEVECEDDVFFDSLRCKQRANIYKIQHAVIDCKNDNKNEVTEYIGKNIDHLA
jgi:hypothetical protein